ncbi:hypothetical protein G4V62_02365 [Bacillaceae bacterium SIJ1]|uniref:hypothetical protein n=1 Tax=Litoribacterium kuwaitense TaxID=1398745 RepID=UPI0013EA03CB|nr:hypothetical protein [Litoribacterium kuwaitense]NGP43848.1 hypothetical protein [Litoribacterium kuwaitense]
MVYWTNLIDGFGLQGAGQWAYERLRRFFNVTSPPKRYDPNQVAYLKALQQHGNGVGRWATMQLMSSYLDVNQMKYLAGLIHDRPASAEAKWAAAAFPNYL